MEKFSLKDIFKSFNLFYFFCVVIFTAQATVLTRPFNGYQGNALAFLIPLILSIIFLVKNRVFSSIDKKTIFVFIFFTLWFFAQFIKYGNSNLSLSFFFFYQLVIAYSLAHVFGFRLFYLFENIVSKLSLVCLICWVVNLLFPSLIDAIIAPISYNNPTGLVKYNIFVVSFLNKATQPDLFYRNPGFSWEPGMYASIVSTAILLNLFRNNFSVKNNKNFIILLCSLFSTFSTTGYIVLSCVILPLLLFQIPAKKGFILFPLFIIFIAIIFQLDFVGNKISNLQSSEESRLEIMQMIEARNNDLYTTDYTFVPQRFDGIAFELQNIIHDPFLGYGVDVSNSYVKKVIGEQIALSNGNFSIIARFGLFFGLLLFILMIRNFAYISELYNVKYGTIFLFFFWFCISMSYNFMVIPFYLSFFLYYYFKK